MSRVPPAIVVSQPPAERRGTTRPGRAAVALAACLSIVAIGASPTASGAEAGYAEIGAAQRREDESAVVALADQAKNLLAARAGIPEGRPEYRQPPDSVTKLSPLEVEAAFQPYYEHILRKKWWRIGEDPTRAEHALRDAASVLAGCLYARDAGCQDGDKLLALAVDAGDYLLWAQNQGGQGLFPFPARSGGRGKEFSAADRFMQAAKKAGRLDNVLASGWIVDDLGDGGLQFDNGVCGVAMLQLYQATSDPKYLKSATRAADWAASQPVVPNWNYNSFSVYLLAEVARATEEQQYLEAATKKARLGVYPGQLSDGANKGRWFDAHNARLPYHYILVRSLISLASSSDEGSAERDRAIEALLLAMRATNHDFANRGIANVDSSMETLLLLEQRFPKSQQQLGEAQQAEALDVLERYCVAKFRAGSPPVAPGVWGLYLKSKAGPARQ